MMLDSRLGLHASFHALIKKYNIHSSESYIDVCTLLKDSFRISVLTRLSGMLFFKLYQFNAHSDSKCFG